MTLWQHILIVAINVGAAFLIFLAITNRILGRLRNRISKPLIVLGLLISLVWPMTLIAVFWPLRVGLWLGGGLWALLALGEILLLGMRVSHRGAPPLERCYFNPAVPRRSAFTPLNTAVDVRLDRYALSLPAWSKRRDDLGRSPTAAPALRIVHLSDWHLTERLPWQYYELIVDQANAAQPDLIFLTGDFITHPSNIVRLPKLLGRLTSRFGAYAILGNHDVWAGATEVIAALKAAGVHYLGGGFARLQIPGAPPIVLAGDETPWHRASRQDWPALQAGEVGLGLSHSADQVLRFSRWGASALFTGHYHGGQFCLPLLGPLIVPSKFGRRYARGHFVVKATHLFVSAGVGCAAPPVRIYCPPDMLVVEATGAGAPGEAAVEAV